MLRGVDVMVCTTKNVYRTVHPTGQIFVYNYNKYNVEIGVMYELLQQYRACAAKPKPFVF